MAPSKSDLQNTLNTMKFGVETGKVRSKTAPLNVIYGLINEHTILLNTTPTQLRIVRSKIIIPKWTEKFVKKVTFFPDLEEITSSKQEDIE